MAAFFSTYGYLIVSTLLGAMLGMSVYLPLMTGQLSLATPGFYALGGYIAAVLSTKLLPFEGMWFPLPWLLVEIFVAGVTALFAGAIIHTSVIKGPFTKALVVFGISDSGFKASSLHYVLMPIGTALIIAGVAVAASKGNANGTAHGISGIVTVSLLILQAAAGTWLYTKKGPDYPKSAGIAHRLSGGIVLVLVAGTAISGSKSQQYASYHKSSPDQVFVYTLVLSAFAIALLLKAIYHAWTIPQNKNSEDRVNLLNY